MEHKHKIKAPTARHPELVNKQVKPSPKGRHKHQIKLTAMVSPRVPTNQLPQMTTIIIVKHRILVREGTNIVKSLELTAMVKTRTKAKHPVIGVQTFKHFNLALRNLPPLKFEPCIGIVWMGLASFRISPLIRDFI
jgi:hypothetical protein